MVFCCADGGKHYVDKNRRDAEEVHNELVVVMMNVLRHVSGHDECIEECSELKIENSASAKESMRLHKGWI